MAFRDVSCPRGRTRPEWPQRRVGPGSRALPFFPPMSLSDVSCLRGRTRLEVSPAIGLSAAAWGFAEGVEAAAVLLRRAPRQVGAHRLCEAALEGVLLARRARLGR